jgi:hypothetical protein
MSGGKSDVGEIELQSLIQFFDNAVTLEGQVLGPDRTGSCYLQDMTLNCCWASLSGYCCPDHLSPTG